MYIFFFFNTFYICRALVNKVMC